MAVPAIYGIRAPGATLDAATDQQTTIRDVLVEVPGARYGSVKISWDVIQPAQPSTAGPGYAYLATDYVMNKDAAYFAANPTSSVKALDDFIAYAHSVTQNTIRLQLAFNISTATPSWAWAETGTWAQTNSFHPVRPFYKANKHGGGSGALAMKTSPAWDEARRFWHQRLITAFADWLNTTCPSGTGGLYPTSHTRKAHFIGWIGSAGMVDSNNEMQEGYEDTPPSLASVSGAGALLTSLTTSGPATFKLGIPFASLSAVTGDCVVVVRTGNSAGSRELIYCSAIASSDAGASTTFTVAPVGWLGNSTSGRGWAAATGSGMPAGGAFSSPAKNFTAGSASITASVYDNSDPNMGGRTGSPLTLIDAAGVTKIGLHPAEPWNRNNYALLGSVDATAYGTVARASGTAPVTITTTEACSTEVARARLYARAWINGFIDLFTLGPADLVVGQMGGGAFAGTGSATAGQGATDSPNDFVRDYLSLAQTGDLAPPFGVDRVFWGYTDMWYGVSDVKPSDGDTDYKGASMATWVGRGCAAQMALRETSSDVVPNDIVKSAEWCLHQWNCHLIAFGTDRKDTPFTTLAAVSTSFSGWVARGVPAFIGTAGSTSKKFSEYWWGYKFNTAFTQTGDANLLTYAIDRRMALLELAEVPATYVLASVELAAMLASSVELVAMSASSTELVAMSASSTEMVAMSVSSAELTTISATSKEGG